MSDEIPKLAAAHQPTLRRLYDALREEYSRPKNWTCSNTYEAGYLRGLNEAINIIVRMNGGYAPDQE